MKMVQSQRYAGLDVHKKSVVVCARLVAPDGIVTIQICRFGTTTAELLNLVAWLVSHDITHVAIESSGEFWKPVSHLLERSFTVLIINAAQLKQVLIWGLDS